MVSFLLIKSFLFKVVALIVIGKIHFMQNITTPIKRGRGFHLAVIEIKANNNFRVINNNSNFEKL